jgi:HSP20 family molecular chaperone IbpA
VAFLDPGVNMSLAQSFERDMRVFEREMRAERLEHEREMREMREQLWVDGLGLEEEMRGLHEDLRAEQQALDEDFDEDGNASEVEFLKDGDDIVVRAHLPGFTEDEVKVRLKSSSLRISAKHTAQDDRQGYHCQRFVFTRTLPAGIDPKSARVSFKDGVLEVRMHDPRNP